MGISNRNKDKRSVIDFSDKSIFMKIGLLFDMLKDYFKGDYTQISKGKLALIIGGLIYIISPIDIIPEFILGFGFIDDFMIAGFILKKIDSVLEQYDFWRKGIRGER
ncbi:MAG: DUF1232 domain-containing protein [Gallicola sp.]|nr:DUF1232 domain-containing protein [Gallicola sp.]